jgi:hypothetical protein
MDTKQHECGTLLECWSNGVARHQFCLSLAPGFSRVSGDVWEEKPFQGFLRKAMKR